MKVLKPILLLAVGLILAAWTSDKVNSEGTVFVPIDPATEMRLVLAYRDSSIKHLLANGYKISTNREYVDLVNRIGYRIATTIAEREDLKDEWEFTVLEPTDPKNATDPRWANAFTCGGGKVIVQSPILELLRGPDGKIDEDMVASIIGHEMTHCIRSHTIQTLSTSGSLDWVLNHLDEITSNGGSNLSQEDKEKLSQAAFGQFRRNQEAEADAFGALYATRAGYDGFNGAIRWMEWANLHLPGYNFEYLPATDSSLSTATHPTWEDRLDSLKQYKAQIAVLAGEFNWGCFALEEFDFDRAAVCFADVVKNFPNSYEAQNNLGLAYHLMYLRNSGANEKFQPGLVSAFVSFRERVRGGESTLSKAIERYRNAIKLEPHATEPRANLAMALVETHDPDNLAEAEAILQKLLTKNPSQPMLVNDMAILLYWKSSPGAERKADLAKAAALFQAAWNQKDADQNLRLPALYNLGVLEIETGDKAQGVSHLVEYLKNQPFGPWADLAKDLVKQNNGEVPTLVAETAVPVKDILNITLGMTEEAVIKILGQPDHQPDQVQNITTSDQDQGQILSYGAIGISVVLHDGKVVSVNVFTPVGVNPRLITEGAGNVPMVGGIKLGAGEEAVRKVLGEPNEVKGDGSLLFYWREESILKVTLRWGKVVRVSLMNRHNV